MDLQLLATLLQKLAAKLVGSYIVVAAIKPVAFYLKLLPEWKIHDVLHMN